MIDKLILDGKVAVIYSPGYGIGWSTSLPLPVREKAVYHPQLAAAILHGGDVEINDSLLDEIFPEAYEWCLPPSTLKTLQVKLIPEGTMFRIKAYDGSETVEIFDPGSYYVA